MPFVGVGGDGMFALHWCQGVVRDHSSSWEEGEWGGRTSPPSWPIFLAIESLLGQVQYFRKPIFANLGTAFR